MSARACIQQWQSLALCVREESPYPRILQAQFLRTAERFTCGRLAVNGSRFKLQRRGASRWAADYTYSRNPAQDVRRNDSDSSSGYARLSQVGEDNDVRIPRLNGHANGGVREGTSTLEEHRFSSAGDVATRNGFREAEQIQGDDQSGKDTQLGSSGDEYYVPVVGHRVIGVVVSGNYAKLDVDIGAAKLGYLHVQDLLSLDRFDIDEKKWDLANEGGAGGSFGVPPSGCPNVVHDEEVYNYTAPDPLVVDVGSVLEMEVVGQTMHGNPLLSVCKASQQLEWDRVMQIKDENEPLQVKILDFNKAGVITRVEGLRAFLPLAEFVKYPDLVNDESLEAYVGSTLWVTIAYARENRGNITLSEKDVWIKRNLQLGSLLDGTVTKIFSYGALVQVNETNIWGMIHISNIADGRVSKISDVFEIGEQVKVILVNSPVPDRLAFSTALLESEPGLMLRDKERVFREAEQTAIALRNKHPEWEQPTEGDDEEKPTTWIHSKPISNLEWLEFQQR
ncbi:hypothetical protein M758_11G064800 [Ceratodon purpureus]|nr:hypothetical protein M758_11G064800 [Ceratodon purpureus]